MAIHNGFRIVKGDLLLMAEAGQFDAIAHGANCFCMMGAGIAAQIAKKWPTVAEADKATEKGAKSKLGTFSQADVPNISGHPVTVYNLYTQHQGGADARYLALRDSFKAMCEDLIHKGIEVLEQSGDNEESHAADFVQIHIGLPYIGAGIGGLDPKQVEEHIKDCLSHIKLQHPSVQLMVTMVEWQRTAPHSELWIYGVDDIRDCFALGQRIVQLQDFELAKFVLQQRNIWTKKNAHEAKHWLSRNYDRFEFWPNIVLLDHDLIPEHYEHTTGSIPYDKWTDEKDWTGYQYLKWIAEFTLEKGLALPRIVPVTQNPIGAKNIRTFEQQFNESTYQPIQPQ